MGSRNTTNQASSQSSGRGDEQVNDQGRGSSTPSSERTLDERAGADTPPPQLNSSTDSDLATILAYLLRSGQMRVIESANARANALSSSDEESDTEFGLAPTSEARIPSDYKPDKSLINVNDIKPLLSYQCGETYNKRRRNVSQMVQKREIGGYGRGNFHGNYSMGDRALMQRAYLPNVMTPVAKYMDKAFCGVYSLNGDTFLTACQDQKLRLYDTKDGHFNLMKSIRARDVGWSVLDTAFSPDGQHVIYSSWSDYIHICNLYGDQETHLALDIVPEERRFCIFTLTFSHDSNEILAGANDGCIYVYDREVNQRILKIDGHEDDLGCVRYADITSQIFYSAGDDGLCKVWDRRTLSESDPKPVGVFAGHSDGITYIDSKGDARYLITNCKDQSIKLWDLRKFSNPQAQEATRRAVSKQSWDYRWMQVPKSTLRTSSLPLDSSVFTYRGHCILHTLIRCHFSPAYTTGQRYVCTGCASGAVVVYDVLTGEVVTKLKGHRACVRDVSWHPYKPELISTSWDGVIGKWTYCGYTAMNSDNDRDPSMRSEVDDGIDSLRQSQRLKQRVMHL